ncbi:transposase [Singulisphaera sp. Ch08]|uniref:Transposase n=1 Tax=Singulisphaera sp. Ch08 TaxID=3120278 RepID=A0AAU7CQE9_9BACT
MATRTASQRRRRPHEIHKPAGTLHPRVQAVGPERFGIVAVDCAKARSKFLLADFYGKVLVPPTLITHDRGGFEAAIQSVREAAQRHRLGVVIVVVERTGRFHLPVQAAFQAAGFEVRIVHPFATKQFRQPADPGNKTDDTDLSAIHRAAVNGFGLLEHEPDPLYIHLQLLARHRRDLVTKNVTLRNQIHDHFQLIMPGFCAVIDPFDSPLPLWIVKNLQSADAILEVGVPGLLRRLREAGFRPHLKTVEKIVAWAKAAPAPHSQSSIYLRLLTTLDEDRMAKLEAIRTVEGDLAGLLVRTPYVLLLGIPGINAVTAAEFAGEMGPIGRYPKARSITGRAGLFPSRYQSDTVDRSNGALVRRGNHSLREVILRIADNLITCNDYFRIQAAKWRLSGKDPRDIHVKVGGRFCRIAYQMVAGQSVFHHPSCQHRHYVLDKLIKFSNEHNIDCARILLILDSAVCQLPRSEHRSEAVPLAEELSRTRSKRGTGPQLLGVILPAVLAKLGVDLLPSKLSGEPDPTE